MTASPSISRRTANATRRKSPKRDLLPPKTGTPCPAAGLNPLRPTAYSLRSTASLLSLHQLPQHRLQNPAVAVVVQLHRRINPHGGRERNRRALPLRHDRQLLSWLEVLAEPRDLERL